MKNLYLKEEIFSWHPRTDSGNYAKQDGWNRCYDYLNIAYKIIREHTAPFELIDCVSNLKRAIDHRIKKIASDYQFKSMSKVGLTQDNLQKFEILGLAKPAIIKTITSIRNVLEHQFKDPPSLDRCSELADFTWYFLKSTDSVCRDVPDSFILSYQYVSGYDSDYWLSFSFGWEKAWQSFEVYGWLKPSHFDFHELSQAQIAIESLQIKKEEEILDISVAQLCDLEDEVPVGLRAICCFTNEAYKKLIQLYFSADQHL